MATILSKTAGAGNGLIRKGLHRRVKTWGERPRLACAPFGSDLDGPERVFPPPGGRLETPSCAQDGRQQPGGPAPGGPPNRRELAVDRAAKAEFVTAMGEVFKAANVVVVAHYSGLTVTQMQTLRRQMKLAGATVKVAKNRLAKIALEGSDVASIAPLLKGPTLIAFSGDPVAAPKVAVDFAKGHERFVILGGAMGKTALDQNGVRALAALPSLDELRAKIVGLVQAPATKIAQVVTAPAAKVARVVQAYATKSETSEAA
jgi:large subunit ribosomal protein L10